MIVLVACLEGRLFHGLPAEWPRFVPRVGKLRRAFDKAPNEKAYSHLTSFERYPAVTAKWGLFRLRLGKEAFGNLGF